MDILIVGTGALACLFAARLAGSGNEVTMLGGWAESLEALRRYGVRLQAQDGSEQNFAVKVLEKSSCSGNYPMCLVLVKSWQTEQTAKLLGSCLSANGIVVTLQNGLGNDEILASNLTAERVALGVTTVGARMIKPGHVQLTGNGKVFLAIHPRINTVEELLQKARFQVELVSDPVSLLWGKLVVNAGINPLTAILRVKNGELLERLSARSILAAATLEAANVAAKQGIKLPYPDPVNAVEEVARNTAANHSSMLQDILRGAVTEIDSINGAIVRMGEQAGVPTPVNRTLWQLVKSLEQH